MTAEARFSSHTNPRAAGPQDSGRGSAPTANGEYRSSTPVGTHIRAATEATSRSQARDSRAHLLVPLHGRPPVCSAILRSAAAWTSSDALSSTGIRTTLWLSHLNTANPQAVFGDIACDGFDTSPVEPSPARRVRTSVRSSRAHEGRLARACRRVWATPPSTRDRTGASKWTGRTCSLGAGGGIAPRVSLREPAGRPARTPASSDRGQWMVAATGMRLNLSASAAPGMRRHPPPRIYGRSGVLVKGRSCRWPGS